MESIRAAKLTSLQEALLSLLGAGIWLREVDNLYLFPLSDSDWRTLFRMAQEQTVACQVFQGVCLLPEHLMPPTQILEEWVVFVDQTERRNAIMNKTQEALLALFETHNLRPVVLKGQGIAQMYPNPLQRTCGDIDLFFPSPDDHRAAIDVIKRAGLEVERMPDGAIFYIYNGVEVEQHQRMIDIYAPDCQSGIKRLISEEGFDGNYPTPLLHLLLLNTHILKHIIGFGVGLRQFVDMALACKSLSGKYDRKQYNAELRKWHIETWSMQLNAFLVDVLGMSEAYLPSEKRASCVDVRLIDKVMVGGNFGKYRADTTAYNGIRKKLNTLSRMLSDCFFSLKVAPREFLSYILRLLVGQFGH